jgi:hypothetical protein
MAAFDDVGAILLHGLPAPNKLDPAVQMHAIRAALRERIPTENIHLYNLLTDLGTRSPDFAAHGVLGERVMQVGHFPQTMRDLLRSESRRLVVCALSAGGWVLRERRRRFSTSVMQPRRSMCGHGRCPSMRWLAWTIRGAIGL